MSKLYIYIFSLVVSLFFTHVIAFDPHALDNSTKMSWCSTQKGVCTGSCQDSGSNGTLVNTCDYVTLNYNCTCSDGNPPNVKDYTLTIPYLECSYDVNNCTKTCNANQNCESACQKPCAANVTATRTLASVTATSATTDTSSAAPTTSVFNAYGGAISLSAPTINVCFVASLTALFVLFARF